MASYKLNQVGVFLVTSFCMISRHSAIIGWSMSKARVHAELGFSGAYMGAMDFAYLLFYSFGNIIGGRICDKYSPKWVTAFSIIILGVLYFLIAFISFVLPYPMLYVVLFALAGFFQGPIWGGGVTMLDNWFPKKSRGGIMGIWGASSPVGNVIGAMLGPLVYEVFGSTWHLIMTIVACFCIIAGFLVMLLKEKPEDIELEKLIDSAETKSSGSYLKALMIPGVILCALGYAGLKLFNYSIGLWLPFYLDASMGFTSAYVGSIQGSYDLAGSIGCIFIGMASDLVSTRFLIIAPLVILSVPFLFFVQTASAYWQFFIFVPLTGICVSGVDGIITTAVCADLADHEKDDMKATVVGIINGTGALSAAIGQFVIGALSDYDWMYVFYFILCMGIFAAVCFIIIGVMQIKKKKIEEDY